MAASEHVEHRFPAVFGIVLALFIACTLLEFASTALRHLKYVVPLAALVLAAPTLGVRPRDERGGYLGAVLGITIAVLVASMLVTLFHQRMTARYLVETYFVCTPVVTAALMFSQTEEPDAEQHARWLFLGFTGAYMIEHGWTILKSARDPFGLAARIATSMLESESTLSLIFGLFCVYFIAIRRWKWAAIAFILTLLGFKRIAIAGVVLAAAAWWILNRTRVDMHKARRWLPIAMIALNGFMLVGIIYLVSGSAGEWLLERFGIPVDFALMGRVELYQLLWEDLGFSWLGHGLGSTTHMLELRRMDVVNAHSDLLKYALEVGIIGSIAWMYVFYRVHCRSSQNFAMAFYLNVLFFTDNVSIYFNVMLTFFILNGFLFVPSTMAVRSGSSTSAIAGISLSKGNPGGASNPASESAAGNAG